MSEIVKGFTFQANSQVTGAELNALLDSAVVDPSVISDKPVDSSINAADKILYLRNSDGTLRAMTPGAISALAAAASVQKTINQNSHGFAVGNLLYYNGSVYALAQ